MPNPHTDLSLSPPLPLPLSLSLSPSLSLPAALLSWLATAQRSAEAFLAHQFSLCTNPPSTKRHSSSMCSAQTSEYAPLCPALRAGPFPKGKHRFCLRSLTCFVRGSSVSSSLPLSLSPSVSLSPPLSLSLPLFPRRSVDRRATLHGRCPVHASQLSDDEACGCLGRVTITASAML